MSAILETGVQSAGILEASDLAGPLPFDFVEFLTQRLGIDRAQAGALLGSHVRVAWDLVECTSAETA